jgi:hypothetical protein
VAAFVACCKLHRYIKHDFERCNSRTLAIKACFVTPVCTTCLEARVVDNNATQLLSAHTVLCLNHSCATTQACNASRCYEPLMVTACMRSPLHSQRVHLFT